VLLRFETGWTVGRSGSGSEFNGWVVAAVWGAELLVMLGAGIVLAWKAASEPFCESCGMWTVSRKLSLPGLSREAADGPISGGDLPALVSLRPADPGPARLVLTAEACPKCRQQGWLSVEEIVAVTKRGKTEEKTKKLLENATLEPDLLARFLERAEQSAAVPVPAA
jgi:hypothetical protein